MEAEILARLQFALTVMFHYIFVPFSIGIGLFLVIFESLYLKTKNEAYERLTRFWIKLFAANFSIGVATGIVLEFEFGTNWATYSRFVGDVFGSPLAAEGIFAFFLESGFLAILLFGWNRVSPRFHLFATFMVFLGSCLSAFWIIAANSWMQTPVAYEIVENGGVLRAEITNFWEMVFNPSTMPRFSHTVVGAFLQGAFLVLSVSAYFILKKRHVDLAQRAMRVGVIVVLIASFTELALGHWSAQVVAEHQPVKLAAMEGHYETAEGVSLTAIGWTDSEAETTTGIEIPKALSFLAFNDFEAEVKGLNDYPRDEWPDVEMVFMTFHIMVALGMLFIAYGVFGVFLLWRKAFFKQKWLLMATVPAVILPILANQLGWVTAERGRQPWVVQDLLRTKDAISKSVSAEEILASIIMFVLLYTLLFFVWVYVLNKEIKHGPELPKSLLKQDLYPQRHERVDVIGKSLPSGYVVKDEREKAAEKHKDQPTPVN